MKCYLEAGALLVLASSPLAAADQKAPASKPTRPPVVQIRPTPPPPKAPKTINDPGASIAQWLLGMTPEQRERALEKFPPERQEQIRERLAKLDARPPQQQQRLIQRYQMFASLPQDKQLLVRAQTQAYNQMPQERKDVVGPELVRLSRMPEDKREARLASENFKSKFTPAEQKMLEDISRYLPLR
jgi:Protein of unknown function (DUF3106)